ncbi:MAG: hypothetical protein RM021_004915 [Nostoc sp. EkiNYC01]|nr:hypothetical protein [Nostoc sp. EkiNYC01]
MGSAIAPSFTIFCKWTIASRIIYPERCLRRAYAYLVLEEIIAISLYLFEARRSLRTCVLNQRTCFAKA